ncbi:UNVERIFIED_CONTAM: hypothetical protein Slati_2097900 [Sesamum latifolium]|uniref:Uncharacterized protein n=1 Tax=Sesamum latifolium TaxID=2727402 RepID=A0AAW2WPW9_9LAMI
MEESHHLLRPLLSPSTTTSSAAAPSLDDYVVDNLKPISSNSSIILRLSLVAFIGIVSIWANHEASKGYDITIVNESGDTFLGKRFQLFYVSNDEVVRLVIRTSKVVENFLYPDHDDSQIRKPVNHIIVKLADRNLTDNIVVESGTHYKFVLNISPSVMEGTNFGRAVFQAIQRGVPRIWLWNGRGNAPESLIHGIVEYMIDHLWGTRPPPVTIGLSHCGQPPRAGIRTTPEWWRSSWTTVSAAGRGSLEN